MSWLTLALIVAGRIFLVLPLKEIDSEFHKRDWIPVLAEKAAGLPILFIDSYRDPSKFSFYHGQQAYSLTDVYYRKNQYDLWDWEKALHDQRVFVVTQGDLDCQNCQILQLPNRGTKKYVIADSFQVSQNVWIDFSLDKDTLRVGEKVKTKVVLENPYPHSILARHGSLPLSLVIIYRNQDSEHLEWYPLSGFPVVWKPGTNYLGELSFSLPAWTKMEGATDLFIGIQTGDLYPAFQSTPSKVQVLTKD
jgi:hypothetical protein